MTRHRYFTTAALLAVVGMGSLTGCDSNEPKANNVDLEVAEIKGIRFDEPAPAAEPATANSSPADAELAAAAANPATSPSPTEKAHATAADVPDNIALIPTMPLEPVKETPAAETVQAPPAEPAPATASAPAATGDYQEVSFNVLSGFKYVEPVPSEGEKPEDVEKRRTADQIPAEVKALDGARAIVQGWMVPMEISEDGSVKSFVLVKTQPECCFGDMQAMNEWVDVIMAPGKNAEFNVDQPVKVYGQLEVGEKTEDGFVLSVYRMKGDRVEL